VAIKLTLTSVTIFSMNIFSLCPEASSRVDILRLLSLFLHHSCYCDIPKNIVRPEDAPHFEVPLEWLVRNFPKLSLIRSLMSWMRLTIRFARINVNSVHSMNTLSLRFYIPFVCPSVSYCAHNHDADPICPLFYFETELFDHF